MNYKILIFYNLAILLIVIQCSNAAKDPCAALLLGDENLKAILNEYLEKIDEDLEPEIKFKQIETFLLKQTCIEKAEFAKGYLRTSPPIKQLFLKTSTKTNIQDVTINFSVEKKELSIEKIIINKSL